MCVRKCQCMCVCVCVCMCMNVRVRACVRARLYVNVSDASLLLTFDPNSQIIDKGMLGVDNLKYNACCCGVCIYVCEHARVRE